jgi:hypothetical protein
MLAWTILKHLRCMLDTDGVAPTHWATVPSLKRHDRDHPLRTIAAPLLRGLAEVAVAAAPDPQSPRGLRPSNLLVPRAKRPHVLLLDDTWVGGGHVQSAAAALKLAGARRVTTLVLARWLDPGWSHTGKFIQEQLQTDFDPDICPFSGRPC